MVNFLLCRRTCVLKTNLQQTMQDSIRGKEELREIDIDDAASCNNYLSIKNTMICRSCKATEIPVLFMPCRHLCLCKDCQVFAKVCQVCQIVTANFEVYQSRRINQNNSHERSFTFNHLIMAPLAFLLPYVFTYVMQKIAPY